MDRTSSRRSLAYSSLLLGEPASTSVRCTCLKGLVALMRKSFRPCPATFSATRSISASLMSATSGSPGTRENQTYSAPSSFAVARDSSKGSRSSFRNIPSLNR